MSAADASLVTPRRSYSVSPYNCFSSSLSSIFLACETWRSLLAFSSSRRRSADSRKRRSAAASSRNLFSAATSSSCARFSWTKASTFGALDCFALMGTSSRLDFLFNGTTPANSCFALRSSSSATRDASRAAARSASSLLTSVCLSLTSASNALIFFWSRVVSVGAAPSFVGRRGDGVVTNA